jgi:hypothetical protein
MRTSVVNRHTTRERTPFKIVCEECGSLSIKIIDPTNLPETAQVRPMSRRPRYPGGPARFGSGGTDLFEF